MKVLLAAAALAGAVRWLGKRSRTQVHRVGRGRP